MKTGKIVLTVLLISFALFFIYHMPGIQSCKLTSDNLDEIIDEIKVLNPRWDGFYSAVYSEDKIIGLDFSPSKSNYALQVAIDDLSPLDKYNLEILIIPNSGLSDISFLRKSNITELDISHSRVNTIMPLRTNKLKKLNIAYTQISDISMLERSNLEELDITGNFRIKDISPLCNINSLSSLKMQGVYPSSKIDIVNMPLRLLYVSPIGTASFNNMLFPSCLQELTIRIIDTDIEYSYVNDTSQLENAFIYSANELKMLKKLNLGLQNFSPENFLTSPLLSEVNLYGCSFEDTRLHIPSNSLEYLNLQHTDIDSLDNICLDNIKTLNISYTMIDEIPPLPKINTLLISNTNVSSLDSVGDECEILDISNTTIDYIPYRIICSLKRIIMRNSVIKDLSFLKEANKLEDLDISSYPYKLDIASIIPDSIKRLTMAWCVLSQETLTIPDNIRLQHLSVQSNKGLKKISLNPSELVTLSIAYSSVSDLSFLPPQGIKNLYLREGVITSLSGIVGSNSQKLDISHCDIDSFEPLKNTSIVYLDVAFSNFTEEDLKYLPFDSLMFLNIAGTGITNIPINTLKAYVLYK